MIGGGNSLGWGKAGTKIPRFAFFSSSIYNLERKEQESGALAEAPCGIVV
jgi:hypothetical protein